MWKILVGLGVLFEKNIKVLCAVLMPDGKYAFTSDRYQHRVEVQLREARTGVRIDSHVFYGSEPPSFPEETRVRDKDYYGPEVPFNEVLDWLLDSSEEESSNEGVSW